MKHGNMEAYRQHIVCLLHLSISTVQNQNNSLSGGTKDK
jgi:hypothetical protein